MNTSEIQTELVKRGEPWTKMPGYAWTMYLQKCTQTKLDPLGGLIYPQQRGGRWCVYVGIDGARTVADRTDRYSPGKETEYEYDEAGDVRSIVSATAFVKKQTKDGTWHEVGAKAFMCEYSTGKSTWSSVPAIMIAKCAEMLAIRRAFPEQLAGIYIPEEMDQAGEHRAPVSTPTQPPKPVAPHVADSPPPPAPVVQAAPPPQQVESSPEPLDAYYATWPIVRVSEHRMLKEGVSSAGRPWKFYLAVYKTLDGVPGEATCISENVNKILEYAVADCDLEPEQCCRLQLVEEEYRGEKKYKIDNAIGCDSYGRPFTQVVTSTIDGVENKPDGMVMVSAGGQRYATWDDVSIRKANQAQASGTAVDIHWYLERGGMVASVITPSEGSTT